MLLILSAPRRALARRLVTGSLALLGGLMAVASARADGVTAYSTSAGLIEGSGVFAGTTRLTAENPSIATFDDFTVVDFTKANFGLNFQATSFSNLTLNLTDRGAAEGAGFTPTAGLFDLYYTLDTTTSIARSTSPLKYTGTVNPPPNGYPQGLTSDGTPTGPSQFTSAPILLMGGISYTPDAKGATTSTVDALSLAGIPNNVFLDVLNGTNGATALRLILAPADLTVAADFYGTSATGSQRPNLTFNVVLNQPTLAWKTGPGTWFPAGTSGDTSWAGGPWDSTKIALFGGTAGTVTLGGAVSAVGAQFDSTGYTVGGGGNALTMTGGATLQVTNASDTATISAPLAGSVGINKIGLGTLILGGTNTYTGATTLTSGILSISSDANLGNAANPVTLAGGTLRTGAALTLGANRTLSGSGGLDMTGGNLLVTGPVNVATLAVSNGTATLGVATPLAPPSANAIATANVNAGATLILNNPLSNSGTLRTFLQGDGNIQLNADNSSFTNGITVNKGTGLVGPTITLAGDSSLGNTQTNLNAGGFQSAANRMITNVVSVGGNVTIGGTTAGTLGNFTFTQLSLYGSSKKTFTINGTTTVTGPITFDATVTNPNSSLNKAGPGTLILTAFNNMYTGGTTVTGGMLEAGGSGALGTGPVTVTAMAVANVVLRIDNNQAIDDLSDVVLTSNGTIRAQLNLNFDPTGGPETINSLTVDGTNIAPGVHTALTDPLYLTGTGSVFVTVPEPSTVGWLGAGAVGLAALVRRRRALC